MARVALIGAVSAAVGAGTLPVLLKQATPTEEAIARIAPPVPRPNESAGPATVIPASLVVPLQADAVRTALPASVEAAVVPPQAAIVASIPTQAEPPPTMAQDESPPAMAAPAAPPAPPATAPAANASSEPFPTVQPLIMDASANAPPSVEQTPPAADAAARAAPRAAAKQAWRKRVTGHRRTRWR